MVRLFAGLTCVFLSAATTADSAPPQHHFWGETRVRYESLDGQFRANLQGGDQLIAVRTLLAGSLSRPSFKVVGELHDARTYLDDRDSPFSTSFVNTADILQAYLALTPGQKDKLKLGRFTLDIASRRFVERNDFRNTINAYTGVHWTRKTADNQLDLFLVEPVRKYPRSSGELGDNEWQLDREDRNRKFWGLHLQRQNLIGNVNADVFIYGLNEDDEARPSADREVFAPGLRLFQAKTPGRLDFDLEFAYRWGHRSRSIDSTADELDVRAHMLHAEVGYTFNNSWRTRVGIEYDLASGDDDPTDGHYERYERFYGTRRGDLGNTSIHGPLTRSNIDALGIRFSFSKGKTDGRLIYQYVTLDSARDSWVVAQLQDPSGEAGDRLGHTFDFRVRHWLIADQLRLEIGGSALRRGSFARNVPGGPEANTYYGYSQLTLTF